MLLLQINFLLETLIVKPWKHLSFCARSGSGGYAAAFQTLENEGYWSTFSHVIEIHFNAAGSGAYGTELITNGGETEKVSSIGKSILDKVSSYTGYNRQIQRI